MATPLIKSLNIQGGTLYTFQSSAKDITKTFNSSEVKFTFSKFACIDIPDIKTPTNKENFIQFDTIDGALLNSTNLSDRNITLAEHFQNYVLNLESLLLKNPDYDNETNKTVSERVFFKWMKEIGAIRFRNANINESSLSRYTEEDPVTGSSNQNYSRVVQYIGDLNVVNNVNLGSETYSQIYINIPSISGSTPTVLFKPVEDNNYKPDMVITGDNDYLLGRNSQTTHPSGLSVRAFYDYDDTINHSGQNEKWMGNNPMTNSYFTEPSTFVNPNNTEIIKIKSDYSISGDSVSYLRSNLDGICIDFDEQSYSQIINDVSVNTFSKFNQSGSSADFKFNAILIYYDLYSVNNPTEKSTNLYGVLFLDNIEDNASAGALIKSFVKYKHNPITGLNGNSYGLKLNLKFDSSIENSLVDTVINDYDSFSLNLFGDALATLRDIGRDYYDMKFKLLSKIEELDLLQNKILTYTDINELKSKVTQLEESFLNANIMISDAQAINDSISTMSLRLDRILRGETAVELSIDFDSLRFGSGFVSSINSDGKMNIDINKQKYSGLIYDSYNYNDNAVNVLSLRPFTNAFYEKEKNILLNGTVYFHIDDSVNSWQNGQSYELSFTDFESNNGVINIKTDRNDRFGNGEYGILIGTIESPSSKSKYQIVCIDKFKYDFIIEQIK